MRLPQYTNKDWLILAFGMPVFVCIINTVLLGWGYFSSLGVFFTATLLTTVIVTAAWQSFTWIAVTLRNRFPKDSELIKRLGIAIVLFVICTALTVTGIY
jgi:hypothetical protein